MKIVILITTYKRPQFLINTLTDIVKQKGNHEIQLVIFEDKSDADYSEVYLWLDKNCPDQVLYLKAPRHFGKKEYWFVITQLYQQLKVIDYDYAVQLPDDMRLIDGFFDKAIAIWNVIDDKRKICLNISCCESRKFRAMWTPVKPELKKFGDTEVIKTGWMDLAILTTKKYFEALDYTIHPIDMNHAADPKLSSGVGMQISKRLYMKYSLWQVNESLVLHGEHDSVMHPDHRKTTPLITNAKLNGPAIFEYNGKTIELHTHNDSIGKALRHSSTFYEIGMLDYIDKNCKKGGTYIDCGANIGNHSVFFAKFCTEDVICFEPIRENFDKLKENLRLNNCRKVESIEAALSDVTSLKAKNIVPDNMGMCNLTEGNEIKTHIGDSFQIENVTLIKIDCEGMDIEVLKGFQNTIREQHPDIFIEAHNTVLFERINKMLQFFGYKFIKQFNATPTYYFKYSPIKSSLRKHNAVVGIASIPSREASLKDAVYSFIHQVDKIFVYLNDYTHVPDFLFHPKVFVKLSQEEIGDIGDAGKFYGLEDYSGYYFTADDDLIYPSDYVATLKKQLEKYNNKIAVSCHGRTFKNFPVQSYYHSATEKYSCLRTVSGNHWIQCPGTGVLAFHTDHVKVSIEDFKAKNMADVWFGLFCQQNKIPVLVLAHKDKWIHESTNYEKQYSIFTYCHNNDAKQTEVINSIQWKVHEPNK